jgi:hypothetical protein
LHVVLQVREWLIKIGRDCDESFRASTLRTATPLSNGHSLDDRLTVLGDDNVFSLFSRLKKMGHLRFGIFKTDLLHGFSPPPAG